jgi:hypothetical protein
MKKTASKSKVAKTPQPTIESLAQTVDWVRCVEDTRRAFGVGYIGEQLSEVLIKGDCMTGTAKIQSKPISLQRSTERMRFLVEVELATGLTSITEDGAHLRWLTELESVIEE